MPIQRPAIPYTLSTILPNGIVTQPPWQGLQDAITSIHQRGKVVISAHSQRYKDAYVPMFGISGTGSGMVYGGPKEIPIRFQIPAGYDRFCMVFAYQFPLMVTAGTNLPKMIHAAIDFRSGEQVHRVFEQVAETPYNVAYNIKMIDGLLPVQANTGAIVSATLSMYINVADVAIGSTFGTGMGSWRGFDFLTMALYRNDAC